MEERVLEPGDLRSSLPTVVVVEASRRDPTAPIDRISIQKISKQDRHTTRRFSRERERAAVWRSF